MPCTIQLPRTRFAHACFIEVVCRAELCGQVGLLFVQSNDTQESKDKNQGAQPRCPASLPNSMTVHTHTDVRHQRCLRELCACASCWHPRPASRFRVSAARHAASSWCCAQPLVLCAALSNGRTLLRFTTRFVSHDAPRGVRDSTTATNIVRSVGRSVGRCVGGAPHTAMFDDEARELSHPRVSDAPPAVRPSVRASVHSSHSRHSVSQSVCLGHGIYNRPYLHRRSRANCPTKPRKCSCR